MIGYNKRLALCLVVVTVLLVVFCSAAELYVEKESDDILSEVAKLRSSVVLGDWEEADSGLERAAEHWQESRRVWLGLLSHREVWTIDEVMISLGAYLGERQEEDVRNQLALLEYYLARAKESDNLNWHNFF